MKFRSVLRLCLFLILLSSCSTIGLRKRSGKDLHLDGSNFEKLEGAYANLPQVGSPAYPLLLHFNSDSTFRNQNFKIALRPAGKNSIYLELYSNENMIYDLEVMGKYRRGYFKVKREWNNVFIAGPLLWILSDNLKYIGLTKENNLVILNSGNSGVMFALFFPLFASGSGQFANEYKRVELPVKTK